MIVIGYQGIGKSTMSKKFLECIDLESSNFRIDGVRADDWYKAYSNIALDLSRQGYIVFTSSHAPVREWLGTRNKTNEKIIICYPAFQLRDQWVKKLEERYNVSNLQKDYIAWKNAEDRYADNIQEMIDDAKKYEFGRCCLLTMTYDLDRDLAGFINRNALTCGLHYRSGYDVKVDACIL